MEEGEIKVIEEIMESEAEELVEIERVGEVEKEKEKCKKKVLQPITHLRIMISILLER